MTLSQETCLLRSAVGTHDGWGGTELLDFIALCIISAEGMLFSITEYSRNRCFTLGGKT